MKIIFTGILLAASSIFPAQATNPPTAPDPAAASAPSVRCAIVLQEWCIANSPATVSMVGLPYRSLWLITSPIGMRYGPLIIIADKTCNESSDLDVSFVGESKKKVGENGEIYEAVYRLHSNGCQLRFEWPAGAADSYNYQEFMAFNIFVGKLGSEIYTPLYKFYNKTRCHGHFVEKGLECK